MIPATSLSCKLTAVTIVLNKLKLSSCDEEKNSDFNLFKDHAITVLYVHIPDTSGFVLNYKLIEFSFL